MHQLPFKNRPKPILGDCDLNEQQEYCPSFPGSELSVMFTAIVNIVHYPALTNLAITALSWACLTSLFLSTIMILIFNCFFSVSLHTGHIASL